MNKRYTVVGGSIWDSQEKLFLDDPERIAAALNAQAVDANTKQQAESYEIACEILEDWQESRVAAGLDPGCCGSVCDGISRLCEMVEEAEAAALNQQAGVVEALRPLAEAVERLDNARHGNDFVGTICAQSQIIEAARAALAAVKEVGRE